MTRTSTRVLVLGVAVCTALPCPRVLARTRVTHVCLTSHHRRCFAYRDFFASGRLIGIRYYDSTDIVGSLL